MGWLHGPLAAAPQRPTHSSFASKAQEASHATVQHCGSAAQTLMQQSRSSQPGLAEGSTHDPPVPQTCANVPLARNQTVAIDERTVRPWRGVDMASRYDVQATRVPT